MGNRLRRWLVPDTPRRKAWQALAYLAVIVLALGAAGIKYAATSYPSPAPPGATATPGGTKGQGTKIPPATQLRQPGVPARQPVIVPVPSHPAPGPSPAASAPPRTPVTVTPSASVTPVTASSTVTPAPVTTEPSASPSEPSAAPSESSPTSPAADAATTTPAPGALRLRP